MRFSQFMRRIAAAISVALSFLLTAAAEERAPRSSVGSGVPTKSSPQAIEAASLVRKALKAEADGDANQRDEYLRQALKADPNDAPAHWQSGEVKIGDQWSPVAAVAHNPWSDNFVQYRRLRDESPNTADAHMRLARWCEDAGLVDQERIHLAAALRLRAAKSQQRDAINKLGLVRYHKQLMSAAAAEVLKRQAKEAEAALKEWKPLLRRLRGDLESRDRERQAAAAEHLKSIDLAAIPAMETVFAQSTSEAAQAAVAALATMPQQAATDSLVRHAIFAKHDEVRHAAAEALEQRERFAYIPPLLSAMNAMIEINFSAGMTEGGAFRERLSLFRESQLHNVSFVSDAALLPRPVGFEGNLTPQTPRIRFPSAAPQIEQTARQTEADAQLATAAVKINAEQQVLNERIAAALRVATHNRDLDDDPKTWWDWWAEYNETHYAPTKPVYEQARSSFRQIAAATATHSCFVPGTLVWTVTGTVPIEEIKVGDWVLSQNVDTGELTYKPVEATTTGPPLPLMEIRTGGETIRSTLGHLFWVSGAGWRMAKELKVGDQLHTSKGTLSIESAEQTGEASCHNLIVPDFNTYFVTDQKILVHDINVRGPTTATVPGLVAD